MSIVITKLEYDCGDKRSYGSLEVVATTPKGELRIVAQLATGGDLEYGEEYAQGVFLDGDRLAVWSFDPGLPHYYAGLRAIDRANKNVDEWVMEALVDALRGPLTKEKDFKVAK